MGRHLGNKRFLKLTFFLWLYSFAAASCEESKPTNLDTCANGACVSKSPQTETNPADAAFHLVATGDMVGGLLLLQELQKAKPSDRTPLRVLRLGLASLQGNTSSEFARAHSLAKANFEGVLELTALADKKVQLQEFSGLRFAYQELNLPEMSAKLGEVIALDFPGLPPVDRAELLLENGYLTKAKEAYQELLLLEPANSQIQAQLTSIQAELDTDIERSILLQSLTLNKESEGHWSQTKPSLFAGVERRSSSELSYEDFYDNFVLRRRPLILTGANLYKGWDWDFVAAICGDTPVLLQGLVPAETSVPWAGLRVLPGEVRLGDWIERVQNGISTENGVVFDSPLTSSKRGCAQLLDKFRVPRFFANDIFKRLPLAQKGLDPFENSPGLFVQPAQSTSALHVDALDSHFVQILLEGRKRWTFYALEPERQRLLLARKRTFQVKEVGPNFTTREASWSEVIGRDGTNETDLLLDVARAHKVEIVLEKGEIMFVPGGTPHQVTQLAPSLAISLNYIDQSNFRSSVEELLWKANFTQDDQRRDALYEILRNPPPHEMEPRELLWTELVG